MSLWALTTFRDGASTTCLGNLFPLLVTLPVENKRDCFHVWGVFSLMLKWNFLYFNLCLLPLVLS